MKCNKCGATLTDSVFCNNCGANVKIYKKLISTSNALYNRGLERAQVRDLTGAKEDLKNSLKVYKRNIPARNLLGLVYFEMGDVVAALSEYTITRFNAFCGTLDFVFESPSHRRKRGISD